ncbi:MAG: hypothetical protein ACNYPD_07510 [Candidatus Halichondribacter symbioticus]
MLPRSGGYAQKTRPSRGAGRHSRSDDEDPQGLKPFISNLGQSTILGNDRPQGGRAHPHPHGCASAYRLYWVSVF